jgi:hypothetical protein
MIELARDTLTFSFPEVHADAVLRVEFQRTLRIPDDGRTYHLPAGVGRFPLRHVDDHAARVPERWTRHGGVMLPMYQSEAMWLNLTSPGGYPFAVKVAAGKINAVTGEPWADGLNTHPQDYMVAPDQPWLDGFVVEKGTIRQFVAMPLGDGYTVEAELTGREEHGGLQIIAYPLEAQAWERLLAERQSLAARRLFDASFAACREAAPDMGLGAGGKMRQEIYEDPYAFEDWDLRHRSRCFVHLVNSLAWRAITGREPPTTPLLAEDYRRNGIPWFDYYGGDARALAAAQALEGLKGITGIGKEKGTNPLPDNTSMVEGEVVKLGPRRPDEVRDGEF